MKGFVTILQSKKKYVKNCKLWDCTKTMWNNTFNFIGEMILLIYKISYYAVYAVQKKEERDD